MAVALLSLADERLWVRHHQLPGRRPHLRHAGRLRSTSGRGPRARLADHRGLCANHTSEEHPWFQESRSSRGNQRREWYVWRDPSPDGGPPNNWLAVPGGSAWELDEHTGQY